MERIIEPSPDEPGRDANEQEPTDDAIRLRAHIESLPGLLPAWRDRDDLREAVRAGVATTFHPSSTCRMGPAGDPLAVVDHAGRVHGVTGMRFADASIFPTGPRANLHGTVVAVAEKLADAISTVPATPIGSGRAAPTCAVRHLPSIPRRATMA